MSRSHAATHAAPHRFQWRSTKHSSGWRAWIPFLLLGTLVPLIGLLATSRVLAPSAIDRPLPPLNVERAEPSAAALAPAAPSEAAPAEPTATADEPVHLQGPALIIRTNFKPRRGDKN